MNNQEIKNAVIEAVRSYTEPFSDEDIIVLEGLYRIFNDADFESKHPRDKEGKFASARSTGSTTSKHKPSKAYIDLIDKVKRENKRTITPNDVIESAMKTYGLKRSDLNYHINRAEEHTADVIKNNAFTNVRYKKDNKYIRAREQKHNKILGDIFANAQKAKPKNGEEPTVIFLGGRGGSGKSKFNGLVYDESKYIVLDADKIKEKLPGYKGYNAYEVHEESSDIMKKALEIARKQKLNVVLDATMKTLSSTEDKIQAFKKDGYNIEMYYMHLPREKAAERALNRFAGKEQKFDGRYVPLSEILEKMKHNEENFDALKHYASKWAFYNNDVPTKDDAPILIDKNYWLRFTHSIS